MTGAQERALNRLKKQHRDLAVNATPNQADDVLVSWRTESAWGPSKTVTSRITPEGRVIEVP